MSAREPLSVSLVERASWRKPPTARRSWIGCLAGLLPSPDQHFESQRCGPKRYAGTMIVIAVDDEEDLRKSCFVETDEGREYRTNPDSKQQSVKRLRGHLRSSLLHEGFVSQMTREYMYSDYKVKLVSEMNCAFWRSCQ